MTSSQSSGAKLHGRRSCAGSWLPGFFALAVIALTAAPPALAKDYFVSSQGNDANDGTVQQPWKTVKKLNSFPFQPGDNIYFERGGIWREPLIVAASGTRDKMISYGAYPNDDTQPRPVISCARNISGVLWEGIVANGGFRDTPGFGQCPAAIPGWSLKSSSGHRCVIEGSSTSSALKLTNLGGNTDAVSNEFNLKAGRRYVFEGRIRAQDSSIHVYLYSGAPNHRNLTTAADGRGSWKAIKEKSAEVAHTSSSADWQTFRIPFTADLDSTARIRVSVRKKNGTAWISDFKVLDLENNYWSVNTDNVLNPSILMVDGQRLSRGEERDENSRWHVNGGEQKIVRYVPASATPEPNIELGNHRTGILLDNKSWVRIEHLKISACEAPLRNSFTEGAGVLLASGSSHNIFSDLLLTNNAHGLRAQGKSARGDFISHNIIEDIEVAYGIDQGIALRSETANNIIRKCIVHDLNVLGSDNDQRDKEGISLGGNTGTGPGNIVEDNEVYNIGIDARGSLGIVAFNSPKTIIRRNYVHDIGANGIGIGSNGKSPYGFRTDDTEIYSNVIVRTGISQKVKPGQGIHVTVSDYGNIIGTRIFNNTVVDCVLNDSKDGGISLRGVANPDGTVNYISDTEIYSNIVSGCAGSHPYALFVGDNRIVGIKNLKSDNNLFVPSPTTPVTQPLINYLGKRYRAKQFWEYRRDSRLDSDSLVADPMFRDRANDDYHLRPDSPAVKAGKTLQKPGAVENEVSGEKPNIGAF